MCPLLIQFINHQLEIQILYCYDLSNEHLLHLLKYPSGFKNIIIKYYQFLLPYFPRSDDSPLHHILITF